MSDQTVVLREVGEGIAQITMQDHIHKNTFSQELIDGLVDAFAKVEAQSKFKVVILTGYDNYFCSGGTQEDLMYLAEGKGQFTDANLYGLLLNCPVPVISAMQGHAIGGGFVIGMYADFVILSRESIYTTIFMKYGFTPGMGATLILPEKLGISLAGEMMLSAKTYYGEELQKRGISFPVLPREQVMEYALDLATNLAEKPRISLVTLKDHLVSHLRRGLPKVIDQEVQMHEKTILRPEVKERIEALYAE